MVATPCTTEENATPMDQRDRRTEHCEEGFEI